MQDFAQSVGCRVPRTIWSGTSLDELADLDLPPRWVLKPNHSSGRVFFGEGQVNLEVLRAATAGWITDHPSVTLRDEWAYTQARKCYVLEEQLGAPGTDLPDYKFFVFNGIPAMIQVDSSRFSGHHRRLYSPDWRPLENRNVYPLGPVSPKPDTLETMLKLAAKVGETFDFIRVDFYDVGGKVYFGEITPYPGGGIEAYSPPDVDIWLGKKWKLPEVQ